MQGAQYLPPALAPVGVENYGSQPSWVPFNCRGQVELNNMLDSRRGLSECGPRYRLDSAYS